MLVAPCRFGERVALGRRYKGPFTMRRLALTLGGLLLAIPTATTSGGSGGPQQKECWFLHGWAQRQA